MSGNYKHLNLDGTASEYAGSLHGVGESGRRLGSKAENDFSRQAGFTARPFATAATPKKEIDQATPHSDRQDAYATLHRQVESYASLTKGWDGDEAEAPNEVAIFWCQEAIRELRTMNFMPFGVTPSVEGGTGIYFENAHKYADIEFFNSQAIVAVISERDCQPIVWEIEPGIDAIVNALKDICVFLRDTHSGAVSV